MTTFLTIFSGVLILVLGQLILKLVIDPVQEFKRSVADISHALIGDAVIVYNPGMTGHEKEKEVSAKFRALSSRLNAQMYLIPKYTITQKVFGFTYKRGSLSGLRSSDWTIKQCI